MILDPFQVALSVADALELCGLPYVVGGSLASSVSGEPRSTLDIDLVVAMTEADVEPFLAALGGSFHADDHALRRAVRQRSSVNLFHRTTATKVDLFIAGGSPLDRQAMRRRVRLRVASDPDRFLYVYTPEDILLQKLRWFRLGGEVSDRQWRDILGIVLVQAQRLDEKYLRDGAHLLDVTDLLERALQAGS
ncbi:MAG: hypothetical protein OXH04_17715 [Acidobacteria bacterium]|nr:hypothetical protein [Acidobacteriota bacterium]